MLVRVERADFLIPLIQTTHPPVGPRTKAWGRIDPLGSEATPEKTDASQMGVVFFVVFILVGSAGKLRGWTPFRGV